MKVELTSIEERVLGCLIEKEMATPEYYPLTLNSLVNACNQKSNRYPVMALDSATVEQTLYTLRTKHKLVIEVSSAGSRVPKYRHNFSDHWNFSPAKMAILCELFVRGPQTPGDLRAHASRLHPLADAAEVDHILHGLENYDGGPFVIHLPCEPGRRERRWAHLFAGDPKIATQPELPFSVQAHSDDSGRIQLLEDEVAQLRQDITELRNEISSLKNRTD
ncbi:MAG TPA: YceH family protein [Pontiella sp.]